jgi:hypothetical protein
VLWKRDGKYGGGKKKKVAGVSHSEQEVHGMYADDAAMGEDEAAGDLGIDVVRDVVLPCLPLKCRPLTELVTGAILNGDSPAPPPSESDTVTVGPALSVLATLLESLTTRFSIHVMLPYGARDTVLKVLGDQLLLDDPATTECLRGFCPEVYFALNRSMDNKALYPVVCRFVLGLCDELELWHQTCIAPPPFEAQPGSYNPEITGMGFRLRKSGERGRVPRVYVTDDDASTCSKQFTLTPTHTGGVFT